MHLGSTSLLFLTTLALYLIYRFLVKPFKYWACRGVKTEKPNRIFGNLKSVITFKESFGQFARHLYEKYPDEPFVGIYLLSKPGLLVRDLDLIKDILIRDFTTFSGRGIPVNTKVEPLMQNLFFMEPDIWRPLRSRLSSSFTSGRLKEMFYILEECGECLEQYTEKCLRKGEIIEVRDLSSKYTTDVIGSCAFGLQMNALSDEENEFRRMGRKVFQMDWLQLIRFWMAALFPKVYDLLWKVFYNKEMTDFFVTNFKETIDYRERNNVRRNDFVDLLRDLRDHPDKLNNIELTDTLMVAQAFVFFSAGFETSSTTISNTLYVLAQNHDIQDKLREEILEEFRRNDERLKYESIKRMKYLHKVFQETLRQYPPAFLLRRKSYASYTFAGTKLSIPKDHDIFISAYGIHYDPLIYPNPEIFDPERFTEEAIKARHPMSFLPFGDGPRNCIGARFAEYQTKVGLIYILRKFRVDVCEKTKIPYETDTTTFLLLPKSGIYLKLEKIQ